MCAWPRMDQFDFLKEGNVMPEEKEKRVTEAQRRAVAKYVKNNYDEIKLRIPKGQRDLWRAAAEKAGESLNAFVIRAVAAQLEREE